MTKKAKNTAPVAGNDNASAGEGAQLVISAAQLLANDSDANGDTLRLASVGKGQGCSVCLDDDGNVVLKVDKNFSGQASFSYTVSDGNGGKATATVYVDVAAVADGPKLKVSDSSGKEDGEIKLHINAALTDKDGSESLKVYVSGVPEGASLSAGELQEDGSWLLTAEELKDLRITPAANSDGDFDLTVRAVSTEASNGSIAETVDTLHVRVNAKADLPVLVVSDAVGIVNTPIALDIRAALTDTDGSEELLIKIAGVPKHATLSAGIKGENGVWLLSEEDLVGLTLTPAPGSERDFTLRIKAIAIEDSNGDRARVLQTLHVTVNPGTAANHAPVVVNDSASVDEDQPSISGNVFVNDSDSDHDAVTVAAPGTYAGAYGDLVLAADGSYTYTHGSLDALTAGQTVQDSFTYQAKDTHGALSGTATLTVSITGTNDAPVITSTSADAIGAVQEDSVLTATGQLSASDADLGATQAWSVVETPADSFGSLTLTDTGHWTYTLDSHNELAEDESHTETFKVRVTDQFNASADQDVTITITGTNDGPAIASTAADAMGSVQEDSVLTATGQLSASDADLGATQIWSVVEAPDTSYGSLTLSETGKWTYTLDSHDELAEGESHTETFKVRVTDQSNASADQNVIITIAGSNDGPMTTSDGGGESAALSVNENSTLVTTVTATDLDAGANLTYAVSGTDAAKFAIDATTGALSFVSAPDFEAPGDSNIDNIYDVNVTVSDGNLTDTQKITVIVGNVNDAAPVITSNGGADAVAISVAEETTTVATVMATDLDAGTSLAYSIAGGADAAKFSIDAATGALSFVSAPSFETPGDAGANNVYDVVVAVSDNGGLMDTQSISVSVTNVDEAPVITSNGGGASAALTVNENAVLVTTVTGTDQDASAPLRFFIVGGADAAKFSINSSTGVLSFLSAPNFEAPTDAGANNVYDVNVLVREGSTAPTDTQSIAVTVANVQEAPVITSNGGGASAVVNIVENSTAHVTTVAVAGDAEASLTYVLSGADAAKFAVSATGALSFVSAPDFESPADAGANNAYNVIVTVADRGLADTQAITVNVENRPEAPVIVSNGGGPLASVSVSENQTAVTTVQVLPETAPPAAFYSLSGADAAKFAIGSSTGVLSFISAPNFEAPTDADADNTYTVRVHATAGSQTDIQDITVTVIDANDAPVITSNGGGTSASVSVNENHQTPVTTVTATDQDPGATLSYALSGADALRFSINAAGELNFVLSPNFEAPADAGENNVYNVNVTASDGSLTDTQALTVLVGNVNEAAPVITSNGGGTSAALIVSENSTAPVTTVQATDADAGTTLSYVLSGADAARFSINASGALSFLTAPNFEVPTDMGADNVYDLNVTVSDGGLADTQAIEVKVINVNEPAVLSASIVNVTEGNSAAAISAAGTLTITDVDSPATFVEQTGTVGLYGNFSIGTNGAWSYTPSSAHNEFAPGSTYTESFDVTSIDGTVKSDAVTINMLGAGEDIDVATLLFSTGFRIFGADAGDESGTSVASAGDVNGDGYDDVIVGAWLADGAGNAKSASGESYVLFGKASGLADIDLATLTTTQGFRIFGWAAGDALGASVASAGDMNADGFDDLIVGAPFEGSSGRSYVIFGKGSSFTDIQPPADGFEIVGSWGGGIGGSVASAGDVNGDGFDDVIIGEPSAERAGVDANGQPIELSSAGRSHVIFGGASGFGLIELDFSSEAFDVDGAEANDESGISVAAAGDVNGDGFDDLIIGASSADAAGNAKSSAGESYVVFGKSNFGKLSLADLTAAQGFRIFGADAADRSGSSVASAGDVNGDGYDDLIIGAPGGRALGNAKASAGESYVLFGKASGFTDIDLAASVAGQGFRIYGADAIDQSALSVASAGDVNGDGYDDLIVGARLADASGNAKIDAGESYVLFGKASGFADVDLATLSAAQGFRIFGADAGDQSGQSVASAGDVNGDGYDDLIIGARIADSVGNARIDAGESTVIFGSDFLGTVLFAGSTANDTFVGTAGANTFVGGQGNDTLIGNGGADVFQGGAGNDTVVVGAALPRDLNGGSGVDTVNLDATGAIIDLSNVNSSRFTNIEKIDLTGANANTLVLDKQAALDMAGANGDAFGDNSLLIKGDAGDRVFIVGWSKGSQVANPEGETGSYVTYTSGDALLRIESDVEVNTGVTITSNGGGSSASLSVAENQTAVTTVTATDPDLGATRSYSIVAGADAARFSINSSSGALTFLPAPNFEAPADAGADNVYDVTVQVIDNGGLTDTQAVAVTVTDVNDAPVISGAAASRDLYGDWVTINPFLTLTAGTTLTGSATVSILNPQAGDALSFASPTGSGITGTYSSGVLTLSGAATAANYEKALESVKFESSSSSYYDRTVTFSVSDGGQASAPVTTHIRPLVSSMLDGSNGLVVVGGTSVMWGAIKLQWASGAGDVNGDGLGDLIFGGSIQNFSYSGVVAVVYGSPNLVSGFNLSSLNGENGFYTYGKDLAGLHAVAGAGDLNGDGVSDVAFSAGPDAHYVVYGGPLPLGAPGTPLLPGVPSGSFLDMNGLGSPIAQKVNQPLVQGVTYEQFTPGDFNGDGIADTFGRTSDGHLRVDFGGGGGDGVVIKNGNSGIGSGRAAGDFNGDGFDDILVNANGLMYVVEGGSFGPGETIDVTDLDGFFHSGFIDAAGDVNGDGKGDLVLSDGNLGIPGSGHVGYVVFGHNSDDTFDAGGGDQTLYGGTGSDWASYASAPAGVDANLATDSASGGGGNDILRSIENLIGSAYDDVLRGDAQANVLRGGGGDDTLEGGAGNDTLIGEGGADVLLGGDGGDIIAISDALFGEIDGGGDSDILRMDGAAWTLDLTLMPNSRIASIETIDLRGGADYTVKLDKKDILALNDNADRMFFYGGAGDKVEVAGDGWTYGGSSTAGGHAWNFFANGAASLQVETTIATTFVDETTNKLVTGGGGNDTLVGGTGNDTLVGGPGDDTLSGSDGADWLWGGMGADTLTGQVGADHYVFDTFDGTMDTISSFSTADFIVFHGSEFAALGTEVTAAEFRSGAGFTTATTDDHNLIYNETNGRLYFDHDGVGGDAATLIATLNNIPELGVADFLVV